MQGCSWPAVRKYIAGIDFKLHDGIESCCLFTASVANWVISRGSTVRDFVSEIGAPSPNAWVQHSCREHPKFVLRLWSSCQRWKSAGQAVSTCDKIDKINDFCRQRKCRISHLSGPKKSFDIVPHGKLSAQLKTWRIYTGPVKWVQHWLKGGHWQQTPKGELSLWSEVTSKHPPGPGAGLNIFHFCTDLGKEHGSVPMTFTAHAMLGASSVHTGMGLLTDNWPWKLK